MSAPHERLTEIFATCRAENRAALVGYLPVGYPTVERSVEAMKTLVEGGCDLIEVGIPYSDPVMDGTTIQNAAFEAIANASGFATSSRPSRRSPPPVAPRS